ncbi:Heat shock protein DnaJ [Cordyceps fumosorosea ARSEF 2679]|uniref:Heat shock protein DnaJ n=1 Tax=Cordyceps fumosorosea (strain ARSEF 2679) TaxID=1081104 RepID=A0A168CKA6_CORFA|nr:Heat shock protein DnaJ [Cordyceps fumosorosea ARSEF 2679]OAA71481.1 Heat shock protein DnaJ [Cordyceps fumosorosea ARSEF 2679]
MDDLSGLDWSKPSGGQPPKAAPMTSNMAYPSLRPSPSPFTSGRNTPASTQGTGSSPFANPPQPQPQQQAKATQDSFSNLARFGPAKTSQNLSLAERQAQLEAEKRKKEEEKRKLTEAQFGNGQQWDMLGSRGQAPSPGLQPPLAAQSSSHDGDDNDLFAAFNKDTKVDNASHFPPPEKETSTRTEQRPLDLSNPNAWSASGSDLAAFPADDDPFGLSEFKSNGAPAAATTWQTRTQPDNDDDFLGDLGRPVEEVRAKQQVAPQRGEPGKPIEDGDSSSSDDDEPPRRPQHDARRPNNGGDAEFDSAVAQLVDYGFAPEDARRALVESGAGTNVQQAANWLLDEAHRKSKAKAQGRPSSNNSNRSERREQPTPGRSEPDFAKSAAAVGSTLFKTANSLWKTGQKKMQQAVADFQQEGGGDPGQPKWMRDAQAKQARGSTREETNATDEAMMLESGGRPRPAKDKGPRGTPDATRSSSPATSSAGQSRSGSVPRWQQQQAAPPLVPNARSRLNRFADDDDTFAISSSRRRKPASPAAEPVKTQPEQDLLFGSEAPRQPSRPTPPPQSAPPTKKPQSNPTPVRKATPIPTRQIPSITPSAMQTCTKHRLEGTAHFKRGDFAQAHASYSSSLAAVPSTHPLAIILLTNRALTALKTGEPKQAVTDADNAISIIGPGNGQGETVAVTGDNGQEENRDMRDLYGKALSRKAEALEQMEKWGDALTVWKLAVEAGLGGATAAKGRQRCQAALTPKPKAAPPKPAAAPRPRPAASAVASLQPPKDSAAVTRLRAANEAAAKEDDEKFALSEQVDAKIAAWRDGKRDNLRGLIASLDQVLWEDSGWKKVGMHELVMANKVKISYMKAIAKTHPDKIAQDASTEVRLIAGSVFSTLNEAWDKFKAENGL